MDVHPPLAKLLLTLAGWLAGFKGDFDFKEIGKDYVEPKVPYVAMRLLPAICGILAVPTIFLTLRAYGCRTTTAALGAGLIIFGAQASRRPLRALMTDFLHREWPPDSVSTHSARFAARHLHRLHRFGLDLLHEPARAGP